ncbi:MAG TPA: hypothetical protein VGG41_14935 [Solirubrobacteraceae bacterium]|jgi:hypothetical protein
MKTKINARGQTRYRDFYRDIGSRTKKSKTFDSSQEADDFELALATAKRGGVLVKRQSTQTLRAFWAEYLDEWASDLERATIDARRQA